MERNAGVDGRSVIVVVTFRRPISEPIAVQRVLNKP